MKHKKIVGVILLLSLFISFPIQGISLDNAIATHKFDLDSSGNTFISDGQFTITNDVDSSITITLDTVSRLISADMKNKEPRMHSIGNNKVVFHPAPTSDWIVLENTTYEILPNSKLTMNYSIVVPRNELDYFVNTSNGYLMYISVVGSGSGNVGINYRTKIFLLFEGEQTNPFLTPYTIIVYSLILALIGFYLYDYKKKRKVRTKGVYDK